jgi:D-amino-acid dehydrogenase
VTRPDVLVVGGGLVGMAAAYRAAGRGAHVVVIEPDAGGSATAAGAGIISPGSRFPPSDAVLPLVKSAIGFYPELMAELAADGETDTGYATTGGLHIAVTESEEEQLRGVLDQVRERHAGGFPHVGDGRLLSGDEARALFPPLSPDVRAAVLIPGSARVDGRLLRAALAVGCERRGVVMMKEAAVLERRGDRVAVRAGADAIDAGAVILAAGAWSGALAASVGVELPVWHQRGQITHLELPGQETTGWPIVLGFHSHYILAFPPDRIVAGATRERVGIDERVTAGGVKEVLDEALRVAPGLAVATLVEMRVGFRPCMPDETPALGRAPGLGNLLIATGHGGYGLQLGPYSGALVAGMALGHDVPLDLTPYDPGRFS